MAYDPKAANTMVSGDKVTVLTGTYDERVTVTRSGASDAPISYEAEGKVITKGFSVTANFITIDGFEITGTLDDWTDGYGIWLRGSYNTIENNYIYDAIRGGMRIFANYGEYDGTSNNIVRKNRLYHNSQIGIDVFGRNNLIEENEIWATIQHHPDWVNPPTDSLDADGISFFGSGHIIRENFIHDISYNQTENIDPHIDCFQSWGNANYEAGHDILFEKNICLNLEVQSLHETGQGFMLRGTSDLTIQNNIIRAYRVVNSIDSPNLRIVNNTFTNDISLTDIYSPFIFYLSGSPNAYIKNNIIYNPEQYVSIADDISRQGLDVGNNLVFRNRPFTWEYPYPGDLWMVDTLFVNAEENDFHFLQVSPAIDAGIKFDSEVDDFDGFTTNWPRYDIGAYENQFNNSITAYPSAVHYDDTLILR
jgi:parallel beta-helix repeat protein